MKEKPRWWPAFAVMLVFALTRWPGLMPPDFSAAYAIAFCAGIYFPGRLGWSLPLGTLVATDLLLNLYYGMVPQWYQLSNYLGYGLLIWLGRHTGSGARFVKILGGGVLGAIAFYLVTNTCAWWINPFHNPEYTRDGAGWILALTKGTAGWPRTWEFFRNTMISGGLFTALFAGAMKLAEALESETKEREGPEEETPENQPDETAA